MYASIWYMWVAMCVPVGMWPWHTGRGQRTAFEYWSCCKTRLAGYRLVSDLLVGAIWDYRCCTPTCSFYLGSGDLKARKDMQSVKRCIASYAILRTLKFFLVIPSQPVSPLFSYKSLIVLKREINLSWRAPGLLAGLEAQWRFSFNKNQVLE